MNFPQKSLWVLFTTIFCLQNSLVFSWDIEEYRNSIVNKDVCVQCNNSDPSSDCRRNPSAAPIVVCSVRRDHRNELVHNSSGCYLKKIGVYYERGCLLDLPSDEQTKCQSESPECQSCFVPFCNVKVDLKVRCYECNSKTNALCEREQNAENAMKFCNDYSKTCGIGIDEFGVTHRGCFSYEDLSTNSSRFPIHSMKCSNNLCNKMAERRIKCHQCEGVGCDSPIGNMTVCKAAQDQCYSYKTEDDIFYRGCLSDSSDGQVLCNENHDKCKKCFDTGCNTHKKEEYNSSNSFRSHFIFTIIAVILSRIW